MSSTVPFLGSKLSLITLSDMRYEGILHMINPEQATISLKNVRSFGTEDRRTPVVPASSETYEFIIFRGPDIKDLTVLEDASQQPEQTLGDPAIIKVEKVHTSQVAEPRKDTYRNVVERTAPVERTQSRYEDRGAPRRDFNERRDYKDRPDYNNRRDVNERRDYNDRRDVNERRDFPERRDYNDRRDYNNRPDYNNRDYNNRDFNNRRDYNDRPDYNRGQRFAPRDRREFTKPIYSSQKNIGELQANENKDFKAEVKEDFDFSTSNAKFEKAENGDVRTGYSKSKGFFDDISCDALDKTGFNRQLRDKVRATDKETFGASLRPFPQRRYNGPQNSRK